jgi:hypothetical protein
MGYLGKGLASVLILIMAISSLSLLMVKPVCAQSIPTPSVPEFTLRFVNNTYFVPETTTYTTNPYTGKTTSSLTGDYFVKNNTIEITIQKQLFPSTINGTATELHFNVRAKGHFEQNWSDLNIPSSDENSITVYWLGYLPPQQDSDYTVLSIPANTYPDAGVVDFQVRAILGIRVFTHIEYYPYSQEDFEYESSDWSPTQTITIADGSISSSISNLPSPTLTPTPTTLSPTPTVPEFPLIVIPLLLSILSFALILSLKAKNNLRICSKYA